MTYQSVRLMEFANQTVFSPSSEDFNIQREKDILAQIRRMRAEAPQLVEDAGQLKTMEENLDTRILGSEKLIHLLEEIRQQNTASRSALQGMIDTWAEEDKRQIEEQKLTDPHLVTHL